MAVTPPVYGATSRKLHIFFSERQDFVRPAHRIRHDISGHFTVANRLKCRVEIVIRRFKVTRRETHGDTVLRQKIRDKICIVRRMVVIVDHDDDGHFHEEQTPGNWLYWSDDGGDTWSPAQRENGIGGFEPDRVMDLPDRSLGVTSHLMRGETQEFAQVLWTSDDGGRSWTERSTIAHNGYHRFCEGAIVVLDSGRRLACVMRENHSGGIPSFVAFSDDNGHNWTEPQMLRFALHRPYAKQLADGRVMVTGRQVNGGLGTYAWVGDLETEAGSYAIGGPRRKYAASLQRHALVIENLPEHECRYTLLPPESPFSEIDFEAELRVEASDGHAAVAFMSISRLGQLLKIGPDHVSITRGRHEVKHSADMTRFRKVALRHRRGWLQVIAGAEGKRHNRWMAKRFYILASFAKRRPRPISMAAIPCGARNLGNGAIPDAAIGDTSAIGLAIPSSRTLPGAGRPIPAATPTNISASA